MLLVSELLAGGGQAPVNSAIAGLRVVPDDIPEDGVAGVVVTAVADTARG